MEKTAEDVYKHASGAASFRKKWNKEKYENLGKERYEKLQLERAKKQKMATGVLKSREHTVELATHVGKTHVVASVREAGFRCDTCRYTVKDSISYYDHLNSPRHLKQIGMGIQTEKATLDQVKQRFTLLKKRKDHGITTVADSDTSKPEPKKPRPTTAASSETTIIQSSHEEKISQEDDSAVSSEDLESMEMAKLMGFKGFSSSKPA
jgi:U4/U6.U5 tri-snRNP component SNU23